MPQFLPPAKAGGHPCGDRVKYMGEPLTTYIKDRNVITF